MAIKALHSTGVKLATPTSGVKFSWIDPSIGERSAVVQSGQTVRYLDPDIGERTFKVP